MAVELDAGGWLVLVVRAPRGADRRLRGLMTCLRESGARQLSRGAWLAPRREGLKERLDDFAARAASAEGLVIIADSRRVEAPPR